MVPWWRLPLKESREHNIQYGDLRRDGCGIHWEIYQDCEGFTRGEFARTEAYIVVIKTELKESFWRYTAVDSLYFWSSPVLPNFYKFDWFSSCFIYYLLLSFLSSPHQSSVIFLRGARIDLGHSIFGVGKAPTKKWGGSNFLIKMLGKKPFLLCILHCSPYEQSLFLSFEKRLCWQGVHCYVSVQKLAPPSPEICPELLDPPTHRKLTRTIDPYYSLHKRCLRSQARQSRLFTRKSVTVNLVAWYVVGEWHKLCKWKLLKLWEAWNETEWKKGASGEKETWNVAKQEWELYWTILFFVSYLCCKISVTSACD